MSRMRRDESGLSLAEVMIASTISLAVLVMVAISLQAASGTATRSLSQSQTLAGPLVAAQEGQRILSSAWTPTTGVSSVTNDCTSNKTGSSFASGNGPFVSVSSTDLQFCSFDLGATTAYTYELYLTSTGCSTTTCLRLEKWPAPGCSPCTVTTKWTVPALGSASTFGTYYYLGTTLTATSTLSQIQVVKLDMTASATSSLGGTRVQRYAVLSNTLGGLE
jgi:hypothetical protein